jgi:hypothetical protein
MNDRVRMAQDKATTEFVADVGRALSNMLGDVDAVCDKFTEEHGRHTAQAVLQLMQHIEDMRQTTAQEERRKLRQESGFPG